MLHQLLVSFVVALAVWCSTVAAQQHIVELTSNGQNYQLAVGSGSTLVGAAEAFCLQHRNALGLDTFDKLVFGCVSSVATAIRDDLARNNLQPIPQGDLSEQLRNLGARPAATQEAKQPAKDTIEFQIMVNGVPYVLAVNPNTFKAINTAEFFCRQKAVDFGITTVAELVTNCIPPVTNAIRNELAKSYDPNSIQNGELSVESANWLRQAQAAEKAAPATAAAAAAAEPAKREFNVKILANDKPYNLVVDLDKFTVLTSAEDFCVRRAADLGISTVEVLVNRCLSAVADVIRNDLARVYDINTIPMGTVSQLSPAVQEFLRHRDVVAAAAAVKNVFELAVPIEGNTYTVRFDRRQSTPMSVAETLCDSRELGLTTLDAVVNLCVPQVANFVRNAVNAEIAPATVDIGAPSEAFRRAQAELARK